LILFYAIDLRNSPETNKQKIKQEVDQYSNQKIFAYDFEILIENTFEKYYI